MASDCEWLIDQLLNEVSSLSACDDEGSRYSRMQKLVKRGWLTCHDSMFGRDYFLITTKGRVNLIAAARAKSGEKGGAR